MRNTILAALCATLLFPLTADAQSGLDKASHHRQQTKNQWRNIGIGAGALGVYGLLKHDNAMAIGGLAGSAYSFSRYEHDRKSQSKVDQARAARYGRTSYYSHGHRYVRRTSYRKRSEILFVRSRITKFHPVCPENKTARAVFDDGAGGFAAIAKDYTVSIALMS